MIVLQKCIQVLMDFATQREIDQANGVDGVDGIGGGDAVVVAGLVLAFLGTSRTLRIIFLTGNVLSIAPPPPPPSLGPADTGDDGDTASAVSPDVWAELGAV
jgi:hypothetical protein